MSSRYTRGDTWLFWTVMAGLAFIVLHEIVRRIG